MSLPSSRQDQRKATRRRIVNAARALFYKRRIGDVSMEEIARTAAIGRATLYLHFPNRDALLLELLAQNLAGVERIYQRLCTLALSDGTALRQWLDDYADTLRDNRDAARLMHIGIATTEQGANLIHSHRTAVADRLAGAFPHAAGPSPRARTRLMLMIQRIDEFASSAAAEPPRVDREAGADIVIEEITSVLAG